jgi:hypothetical protein
MLNWPKLVAEGRAKAQGVPWTEEEQAAIHELGIPPEYVRNGCLTVEDYAKAKSGDSRKYRKLDEIRREADVLGVTYAPSTPRAELLELIELKKGDNSAPGNAGAPPAAPDLE